MASLHGSKAPTRGAAPTLNPNKTLTLQRCRSGRRTGRPLPVASLHRSEAPTRGAAPTATAGEAASHVPVQTLNLRIHRRVPYRQAATGGQLAQERGAHKGRCAHRHRWRGRQPHARAVACVQRIEQRLPPARARLTSGRASTMSTICTVQGWMPRPLLGQHSHTLRLRQALGLTWVAAPASAPHVRQAGPRGGAPVGGHARGGAD